VSRLEALGVAGQIAKAVAVTRDARLIGAVIAPSASGPTMSVIAYGDEEDMVVLAAQLLIQASQRLKAAGYSLSTLNLKIERALDHLPTDWDGYSGMTKVAVVDGPVEAAR
jgi:hypothetical protein